MMQGGTTVFPHLMEHPDGTLGAFFDITPFKHYAFFGTLESHNGAKTSKEASRPVQNEAARAVLKDGAATVKLLSLILCMIMSVGCASQTAEEKYRKTLDPLLHHASKQDIIGMYGMPTRTSTIDGQEVLYYKKSYGTRSTHAGRYGVGAGASFESYDALTFIFDEKGILVNYHVECRR